MAALAMAFGALMLVMDYAIGMPWYWTLSEGPFVFLLGGTILGLVASLEQVPAGTPSGSARPSPERETR